MPRRVSIGAAVEQRERRQLAEQGGEIAAYHRHQQGRQQRQRQQVQEVAAHAPALRTVELSHGRRTLAAASVLDGKDAFQAPWQVDRPSVATSSSVPSRTAHDLPLRHRLSSLRFAPL